MSNYDEEMFEYLTSTENYSNVVTVVELWESLDIKNKIICNFWDLVTTKIKKELKVYDGWNVHFDEQYNGDISIYHDSWKNEKGNSDLKFSWQNMRKKPSYGIWVNQRFPTNLNVDALKNELRASDQIQQKFDFLVWVLLKNRQEDFNNIKELGGILPNTDSQEMMAAEFTKELIGLFLNTKDLLLEVFEKHRKG